MSRVPPDSKQGSAWLRWGTESAEPRSPDTNGRPRGRHFAPFKEPELYAEELRAFFRPYRAATG